MQKPFYTVEQSLPYLLIRPMSPTTNTSDLSKYGSLHYHANITSIQYKSSFYPLDKYPMIYFLSQIINEEWNICKSLHRYFG